MFFVLVLVGSTEKGGSHTLSLLPLLSPISNPHPSRRSPAPSAISLLAVAALLVVPEPDPRGGAPPCSTWRASMLPPLVAEAAMKLVAALGALGCCAGGVVRGRSRPPMARRRRSAPPSAVPVGLELVAA